MSQSSPYFGSVKPNFFAKLRDRTFNEERDKQGGTSPEQKRSSGSSSSNSKSSSGLGNLSPSSTDSSNLKYKSTSTISPAPSSATSHTPSSELDNSTRSPSSNNPTTPTTSNNETFGLDKLPLIEAQLDTQTTPPVPKPRTKKPPTSNQVPKPRPKSYNGEDSFVRLSTSDTTFTPPIPAPRKNKPTIASNPRERIYSKGSKEYKEQKESTNYSPPHVPPVTTTKGGNVKGPGLFPQLPFYTSLDDEPPRSIIAIVDLESEMSIRNNYLKLDDLQVEIEPDSDEETNEQIAVLEAKEAIGLREDVTNDDDTLTNTPTIKTFREQTLKEPTKKPPTKPPRSRSRSPGKSRKNISEDLPHIDPTVALGRSHTLTSFEDKSKRSFWKPKSPFSRRKSRPKEEPWEFIGNDPDTQSVVSESGILSPAEYPLHKTKQVKEMHEILIRNPSIDVNKRDSYYNTPIHYILKKGKARPKRCELLMTLLQTGRVDVNALDVDDNTPLHIAAENNYYRCAAVLLAFNANPFIRNKQLQQPIELADTASKLFTLLSKQCEPLDNDEVKLSSLPEATGPVDPQELANEKIGRLLMPDKIAGFVRKLDADVKEFEYESFVDSYEPQPMSITQLTDQELDKRKCIDVQKFYLKNWKQTSGSRVLFLDGGGIRGLVQIEIMMELEKRTGRKITELFDWIVGTSTGGIVALGLVYGGKTLEQMRQLYFKMKNEVFDGAGIAGTFMSMPQKSKKFDKILKKEFGEDILMSSVTHPRVMICAVNKEITPLKVVFFNNFMEENPELREIQVWKAARASSAAPMYFTECDGKYIDGGVLANNPCEFAMTQINLYDQKMRLPPRHFALAVSIGTGIFPDQNLGDGKEFGVFNLKKHVKYLKEVTELFAAAVANSEMTAEKFAVWCDQWKNPIPFFRFNPRLQRVVSPGDVDDERLIDMLLDTKQYLAEEKTQENFVKVVRVFKRLQADK